MALYAWATLVAGEKGEARYMYVAFVCILYILLNLPLERDIVCIDSNVKVKIFDFDELCLRQLKSYDLCGAFMYMSFMYMCCHLSQC